MRGAWLTGGPCWLKLCENSVSPVKDVLDVRQSSQGPASESPFIRPVLQTSVRDSLFVYGKKTNHSFHIHPEGGQTGSVQSGENNTLKVEPRFRMVLDKYETINQHTEYEDSFLLIHMDSMAIIGGVIASIFIWIMCYRIIRSKGARKYFNLCCTRCCEGGGTSNGRREEIINIRNSNVSKPTVVSISEALTEMEKLQEARAKKKIMHKPTAPEYVMPREEVSRYKELQQVVDKAYKEVMEEDP